MIAWRREDKINAQIERAAEKVTEHLVNHGLHVFIDTRRDYTPAQKFAVGSWIRF